MRLGERQQQLDKLLPDFRDLWHPQPFRESRPAWVECQPALSAELLALSDAELAKLERDSDAALALLVRYLPDIAELAVLTELPSLPPASLRARNPCWDWEIPGRKREQIEAFAATVLSGGQPVLDWCGGKGHLGRLLASQWQVDVETLDIDPVLCAAGEQLAARQNIGHAFVVADALAETAWPKAGQHAVALHACGDLHRSLIERGVARSVGSIDLAPCCYHRGVGAYYQALSSTARLGLTRDDTRLAVTETVTASARLARHRDRQMAWKLGFDAYRKMVAEAAYKSFKPVPASWFQGDFLAFLTGMAGREVLPLPSAALADACERLGWLRQREVMRLSIVRHAFRRSLEVWLVLDLAVYLESRGYAVTVGSFCERRLTPRNLLISARRG